MSRSGLFYGLKNASLIGVSKQLTELNEKLDILLSKKQIFFRGIIRGLGIAVGTTIIAAIVLTILGAVLRSVDLADTLIIRDVINQPKDR